MSNRDKYFTSAKRAASNGFLSVAAATFALGVATAPAHAGTIYDETVSGDFSNDGLSPTSLAFGLGSNEVFGATGRAIAGGPVDRDYSPSLWAPGWC